MKGGNYMAKKKADIVESGEEIVKAAPKRSMITNALKGDMGVDRGDNTKIVQTNMRFFDMPKIDLHDSEAVRVRLGEYFQIYADADLKPTVAGMACALGVNRQRLWEIKTGAAVGGTTKQSLPSETLDLIKKAYEILEMSMENYASSGKVNPVISIFMMKNHFGYQDKTEYVLTPNQQQASDYDADDIRKRYLSDSATINSED
jgi:hypothetical protein